MTVDAGNRGVEANQKKADGFITRRKLMDLVRAQSDEIELLRGELERLRRRTFPSFAQLPTAGVGRRFRR